MTTRKSKNKIFTKYFFNLIFVIYYLLTTIYFPTNFAFAQETTSSAQIATNSASFQQSALPSPTIASIPSLTPSPTSEPAFFPLLELLDTGNSAAIQQPLAVLPPEPIHFKPGESVSLTILNTAGKNLSLSLINAWDQTVEIPIQQEKSSQNTTITIDSEQTVPPGKYTLLAKSGSEEIRQSFTWGLLSLSFDKNAYFPGDSVQAQLTLLNEQGLFLCKGDITIEITDPQGQIDTRSTKDNLIQSNDICIPEKSSDQPQYLTQFPVSLPGNYTLTTTARTKESIIERTDTISVGDVQPFIITRSGSKQASPPQPVNMSITITAQQDFDGTVIETLPESFSLLPESLTPASAAVQISPIKLTQDNQWITLGLPLEGNYSITQGFGDELTDPRLISLYRQYGVAGHDGVDFALPINTPIIAADDGEVVFAGSDGPYGFTVILKHSFGQTYYGHLSSSLVQLKQKVIKGEKIALSGNSGLSLGSHLHFALRRADYDDQNGYYGKTDPVPYLSGAASAAPSVKKLRWSLQLTKGQTVTLSYQFRLPQSPARVYMIPPLEFVQGEQTFTPLQKPWQITVDATAIASYADDIPLVIQDKIRHRQMGTGIELKEEKLDKTPDKFLLELDQIAEIELIAENRLAEKETLHAKRSELQKTVKSRILRKKSRQEFLSYHLQESGSEDVRVFNRTLEGVQRYTIGRSTPEVELAGKKEESSIFFPAASARPIFQYRAPDGAWQDYKTASGSNSLSVKEKKPESTIIEQSFALYPADQPEATVSASVELKIGLENDEEISKFTFSLGENERTNRLIWRNTIQEPEAIEALGKAKPEKSRLQLADVILDWSDFTSQPASPPVAVEKTNASLNLIFYPEGRAGALTVDPTLSLSTAANTIQIDVADRYRAVMKTNDTTDYLTFSDRDEDDATPDATQEFIGPNIKTAGGSAPTQASSSATISGFTSTSYTVMTDGVTPMSITPGAGDYLVWFSGTLGDDDSNPTKINVALHVNAVIVQHTEREMDAETSIADTGEKSAFPVSIVAEVLDVNAGEAIDIRWKVGSGDTGRALERNLVVMPITDADVVTATAIDTQTTSSTSDTLMPSMTITDPGAGDYLVWFTTSLNDPNSTGTNYTQFIALSDDSGSTTIGHTDREYPVDASINNPNYFPMETHAKVTNLSATDDIQVYWRITVGTPEQASVNDRTLVAYKIDEGSTFQASATTGSTTTETSYTTVMNSMTITDPGAGDYLIWFSGTINSQTNDIAQLSTIFTGGSQVTHTERESWGDESLTPFTGFVHVSHAYVTGLTATDDIQVFWKSGAAGTSEVDERTLMAMKITTATDSELRYHNTRTTTILENTSARVRLRVNGCLDTAAGGACLTDGTDNILVNEEYTFTPEGMFVVNDTNFRTNGVALASTEVDDGYNWMMIEADVTDAAYDDTQSIYYGDGTTESSTTTDGVAFEDSNVYTTLLGHGTGSYQSAQIGILTWLSQAGGTDDWYWDENYSTTLDRLFTREQGTTPTGTKTMRWYFQMRPKTDLDTEAEREAYINDYRNPDTLSFTTGSAWQEVGSDEWNESEGTYTIAMSSNTAKFDIDGGTYARYNPYFKFRNWRRTNEILSATLNREIILNSSYTYNAGLKPFSDADFFDDSLATYTQLAVGGNDADSNEYLNDATNDYTIAFAASDFLYLGSDDPFTGVNVDLATLGSGASPDVTWQYCSANTDTATACDTWSSLTVTDTDSGANDFTASGNFYFTEPSWVLATVNSGPSLYYIRGSLTSGSYSTNPVENTIRTDIAVFQYLDNLSSNSQTLRISNTADLVQLMRHGKWFSSTNVKQPFSF